MSCIFLGKGGVVFFFFVYLLSIDIRMSRARVIDPMGSVVFLSKGPSAPLKGVWGQLAQGHILRILKSSSSIDETKRKLKRRTVALGRTSLCRLLSDLKYILYTCQYTCQAKVEGLWGHGLDGHGSSTKQVFLRASPLFLDRSSQRLPLVYSLFERLKVGKTCIEGVFIHSQMALGQKDANPWGPQVLVYFSFNQ